MPRRDKKITKRAEVERIFRAWQALLWLEHWEIEITWEDDRSEDARTAGVRPSKRYDSATLVFNAPQVLGMTRRHINETVVHELLHCMRRDLDDDVPERYSRWIPPAVFDSERARHYNDVEQYVERMSRILVELHGVV